MDQRDIDRVNEPIPNVALLDKVMQTIKTQPKAWAQDSWGDMVLESNATEFDTSTEPCGTTHCFAGYTVELDGIAHLDIVKSSFDNGDGDQEFWDTRWVDPKTGNRFLESAIGPSAMKALGLTPAEADGIFFCWTDDPLELEVRVEEVKLRAKRQQEAFDRIARELIESVPELAEVLKPGYLCPESRAIILDHIRKFGEDH